MKLGTHMPGGERGKPIYIEDRRTKVKVTTSKNRTKIRYFFLFPHDILRTKCLIYMNLGTHMPDGERRKPIDIEVCRSKVKVTTFKNRTNLILFLFRTITQVQETKYTHAERNKSHELEVCGSKVKITISKNRTVI
jgi:hypothetical protein